MTENFYRLEITTNVWLVQTPLNFPLGRFIFSGSGSLETRGQVIMAQNRWFLRWPWDFEVMDWTSKYLPLEIHWKSTGVRRTWTIF